MRVAYYCEEMSLNKFSENGYHLSVPQQVPLDMRPVSLLKGISSP